MVPEQQTQRKETDGLKNLPKKEQRRHFTETLASTGEAPGASNQPDTSCQTQPGLASLLTQRLTTSTNKSKSDLKGKERRPTDLLCSNPSKILIKKKEGGACTKADFAQIQPSFIRARLGLVREAGGLCNQSRYKTAILWMEGLRSLV